MPLSVSAEEEEEEVASIISTNMEENLEGTGGEREQSATTAPPFEDGGEDSLEARPPEPVGFAPVDEDRMEVKDLDYSDELDEGRKGN